MNPTDRVAKNPWPPVPKWLAAKVPVPRPTPGMADVSILRSEAGLHDTNSLHLNFQRILEREGMGLPALRADAANFLVAIIQIEQAWGTATAFAFALAVESAMETRDEVLAFGKGLDGLLPFEQIKPWEHGAVKYGLPAVVARCLDPQYETVEGDCVDLLTLKTFLFLRSGIPAGMVSTHDHAESVIAGTAVRPHKNFLGVIAQVTADRANFYREIALSGSNINWSLLEQAEKLYQRAKVVDCTNPEIYTGLGQIASLKGEEEQALILLSTAIELGSRNPAAFILRGMLLFSSGHIPEATADARWAAGLEPQVDLPPELRSLIA